VVGVDLDRRSLEIEMTVEALAASEVHQKTGLILGALERGGNSSCRTAPRRLIASGAAWCRVGRRGVDWACSAAWLLWRLASSRGLLGLGDMAATKNRTTGAFDPWDTAEDAAVAKFVEFAKGWSTTGLSVHEAKARLDENREGEPVMRVQLLLSDPDGSTWDFDRLQELRTALGRKATELGLPFVNLTLIAEREASAELFAR